MTLLMKPYLGEEEALEELESLEQILDPSQECVDKALQHARPTTLTHLFSTYFDYSENTFRLCLILHNSVHWARLTYRDLHNFLNVCPLDSDPNSLTQSKCDWAFDIFLKFDRLNNPFPCPDSHNFRDVRHCFSLLRDQLRRPLRKSRYRVRLRRATTCSAVCLTGPLLPVVLPSKITKKEIAHIAQVDAVAMHTYALRNDLDTIDRLVNRLYTDVEGDKLLIRLGLEMGNDRHPIHMIAKQLQKNHLNFLSQLTNLEEHIYLCLRAINKARSLLLEEFHLHKNS
ncbi:hypothetical protein RHMOL_Rhmol04G0290900 [Rhododendron molle]|uniref:Uncharacterized protein n=3 Tax=Rhododendron molle TaxID=49168 RepID=A0ACC0P6T1_RHOML|nr:hypothetical protein RHMOL_Rhmol04G0290900 [Rhododendron molle]KAI8560886.1 hypothetical protein RHMOL_Rhmol04G0290900 [Rhododendron molle]KAI8560887.1 hypothetical protein RHMOL_Rhmol04G0290900 [Rhododendron molle]